MPRKIIRRKRVFKRRNYARRGLIRFKNPNTKLGIYYFKRTLNAFAQATCVTDAGLGGVGVSRQGGGLGNYFIFNSGSTISNNTFGSLNYTFRIADLPAVTDFTTLYDSYKISMVVVKLIPYSTTTEGPNPNISGVNGGFNAIIHSVIDYDSTPTGFAATEAGVQSLQQYSSYKKKRFIGMKPLKFVLRPKPQMAMLGNASATVFAEPTRKQIPWLDVANTDIPHFGLFMIFEGICPSSTASFLNFRVETTYYLKFRGVR